MLTFRAATSVLAPPPKTYQHDQDMVGYHRDLLEPFGVPLEAGRLRAGANLSHTDLVTYLLDDDRIRAAKPGLVMVAYALPDLQPFKTLASHVNMLYGNEAHSFAISDQGVGSPFTALRIALGYQVTGECDEVVLVVVEQTTLPNYDPAVSDYFLVDSGALLHFAPGPGFRLSYVAAVPEGEVPAVPADDPADATLVVAGARVPMDITDNLGGPLHVARRDTYCTSVWLALADHADEWSGRYRRVVLIDRDLYCGPTYLAVLDATVGVPAQPEPGADIG